MARPRRERVAVNLQIPFHIWQRDHALCMTRTDVPLHTLLLARCEQLIKGA